MNVKLRVLSAGALFFLGQVAFAQTVRKDTTSKEKQIEEVVLVGYTQKKKEAITTAVSTVKASEINNVPVGNFVQNLGGRLAGVDIMVGSGQPGAGGNIIIRGVGSINGGTTPLYVVDGVPLNSTAFAALNPNDFEEVTVLKDAASKSIYGAAAGAGVVLIKTKSGKNGFQVQYTGQAGISEKGKYKYQLMDTNQWLNWNRSWGNFDDNDVALYQARGINTDWNKVFLRTGFSLTNDVAISGGAGNTNYYVSLGQFSQDGIAQASSLDRYTLNSRINSGNGRNFRFGIQNNLSFNRLKGIVGEAGVFINNPFFALNTAPILSPYNPDGSFASGASGQGIYGEPNYGARALEQALTGQRGRNQVKILSSAFGEYDLSSNFTARVFGGIDYTQNNTTNYTNPNTYYGSTTSPGQSGALSRSLASATTLTSNFRLAYKNTWNDVHNFNAFILGEYVGRFRENFGYTGYGLDKSFGATPVAITVSQTILPSISGGSVRFTTLAALGSFSYNYDNKYFIDANIRRDASSQFSKSKKAATFGGVSAAWAINKENFLADSRIINNLKLRASWGLTGNIGDPTTLNPYNDLQYYNYGGLYNNTRTLAVGSPLNPNYVWEKEDQINIGLDYGLFNDRIWGSFDIYDRETKDLFIDYNLSATSGFTTLTNYNSGKMSNKGVEIDFHADIVRNSDLRVSVFANFAYNKNLIKDLGQVTQFESGTSIIRVGEAYGSHFIVGWAGVNPQTGAPIYQDLNGNPTEVYDPANNKTGWGTSYAPYKGGFGLDLKYKGFFLNSQFQWKSGYSRFNNQRFFQEKSKFLVFKSKC